MATAKQIKEHIAEFAPVIRRVATERGYKVASAIIAQSITESVSSRDASGWSVLKYKHHNMFGLKCGKYWKGASVNLKTGEEYTPGTITVISDNFCSFDTFEDGINGYFDFISTSRYANLKTAATAEEYLKLIKKDGYCTSSTYYTTNMGFVNKYGLKQYDTASTPTPTLRRGSDDRTLGGNYVESWQLLLSQIGLYRGAIDGVFGYRTEQAVIAYQGLHGLTKDGIVGPKTWATIST